MDFILNNKASGGVAARMLQPGFSVNSLRPYFSNDGQHVLETQVVNGKAQTVVSNAPATLRKDDWITLDAAVVQAAKERLRVVTDMRSAGLVHRLPNGMGHTVLQTETQSDINDATISMDGLRKGNNDRPEYELNNLPLPIVHKDFGFSSRQIAASRNGGSPLDTTMAALAGRRVAEEVEKLLLGVAPSYSYGGGSIYGFTNFPDRLTFTISDPTGGGWVPQNLVDEVLAMRTLSQQAKHYGPWAIYTGLAWDQYLDGDFSAAKGSNTLRERLLQIQGIDSVVTADYLTGFDIIMVQKSADVARMVNGLDLTTVQWDTDGGFMINFKVLTIQVPQLRADFYGNTGIVHGSI